MAYIALIAHDGKKSEIISLAKRWSSVLKRSRVVATHTTGTEIERETGITIKKVQSGPLGGDLQIGALIATGDVSAVVFLRDPLTAHPHEPDISALMKVCDTHNVPLATNSASAELIMQYVAEQLLEVEESAG